MIKSYNQIKREQKKKESRLQKVRQFFSVSRFNLEKGWKGMRGKVFKKVYLKKGFAFVTIIAVIVTAYWQGTPQANAATFTL
jgi:hypothetical protein